jgi:hypothetical protein
VLSPSTNQAAFLHGVREGSNNALNIGGVILDWSEHRLNPERRRHELGSTQVETIIRSGLGIDYESRVHELRLDLLEHP